MTRDNPLGLAACKVAATPCFRSLAISKNTSILRRAQDGGGKRGAWPSLSIIIYVARSPAPRRRSCPSGGHGRCRWSPLRPGPGGSSPSRATEGHDLSKSGYPLSGITSRRDRSGAAALPDTRCAPGSRESDDGEYGRSQRSVNKSARLFFEIERDQWVGRRISPHGFFHTRAARSLRDSMRINKAALLIRKAAQSTGISRCKPPRNGPRRVDSRRPHSARRPLR